MAAIANEWAKGSGIISAIRQRIKTKTNDGEKTMKNAMTIFLTLVLFCATSFAGDMGSGGRTCTTDPETGIETCNAVAGETNSSKPDDSTSITSTSEEESGIFESVVDYFESLLGIY